MGRHQLGCAATAASSIEQAVDEEEQPIEVPHGDIPTDTLRAIVEDFCTRDGTDYGEAELSLTQKVSMLMRQLENGDAHILFEATTGSLRIVTKTELQRAR